MTGDFSAFSLLRYILWFGLVLVLFGFAFDSPPLGFSAVFLILQFWVRHLVSVLAVRVRSCV